MTTAIVLIKHTYVVTSQDKETRLLYLLELETNGNLKNKFVYKMKDGETFPQQGFFKITYREKDKEDYWPMIATEVQFQYI